MEKVTDNIKVEAVLAQEQTLQGDILKKGVCITQFDGNGNIDSQMYLFDWDVTKLVSAIQKEYIQAVIMSNKNGNVQEENKPFEEEGWLVNIPPFKGTDKL